MEDLVDTTELFERLPDPRAREELFEHYRPLAIHLAKRYFRRGIEQEDLLQVAFLGLVNAIDRFDPEYGSRFVSFAVPTITGELKRYFRDTGWATGVPRRLKDANVSTRRANEILTQRLGRSPTVDEVAELTGLAREDVADAAALGSAYRPEPLDAPHSAGDEWTPLQTIGDVDQRFDLIEDLDALRGIWEGLNERDRQILYLRFECELTQRQIADRIGISQMHVSRLLSACLEGMRSEMLADSAAG